MSSTANGLLAQFENLEISAPDFHHRDHVLVAYEMLGEYDFVDACTRYAQTIRAMALGVGVPEKYNVTITFAFMSLVAERKARGQHADSASFLISNPDLLQKNLLENWYSRKRLASATARRQFLLPDKAGMA